MTLQNNLIPVIARKYGIKRGDSESMDQWKNRVFYTLLGQMGYASLWDTEDDNKQISVTHFKTRIKTIYMSYCSIFHELQYSFRKGTDIEELLLNVFKKAGYIYHSSYRLAPAKFSTAQVDNILFVRGLAPGEQSLISGLGTYRLSENDNLKDNSIYEMFQIPDRPLSEAWSILQNNRVWSEFHGGRQNEFFNTEIHLSGQEDWKPDAPSHQDIALLRMGEKGNWLYYLYKKEEDKSYVSQLPVWMMEETKFYRVANELLFSLSKLPPIKYKIDNEIVTIRIQNRLPDEEWNFIMIYSWPLQYSNLRIMKKDVFYAVKKVLEPVGYQFVKE